MDIRALLLSTVALAATGCSTVWNCKPASEDFTLTDETVTMGDMQDTLRAWGVDASDELECWQICQTVYQNERGWESNVDQDRCDATLDAVIITSDDTGADEDQPVGSISCSGEGFEYFCEGRRPLGHHEIRDRADGLGPYLARCAHLEAASVTAFDQLAAQLRRWGAPADLVARCQRAAREEADHASVVTQLAARHGAQPAPPQQAAAGDDRLTVALHNAVEGCVFETWAAAVAFLKAQRASDRDIRAAYAQIADEEARHGQLAWDLHRWLMAQLSADERAQVHAAQQDALARLPRIAAAQVRAMPDEMGMPDTQTAAEMAAHLAQRLAA